MKKIFLSMAVAATLTIGMSACNSTKDATNDTDSTMVDSTKMMKDTTVTDTNTRKVPDTTRTNGPL